MSYYPRPHDYPRPHKPNTTHIPTHAKPILREKERKRKGERASFDDRRGMVWWWKWFDQMRKGRVTEMVKPRDKMRKGGVRWEKKWGKEKGELLKPRDKKREKIIKILNTNATVTVHICTVTIAIMYKCTILHLLMWVFFGPKCVKGVTFSVLQNFTQADVVAPPTLSFCSKKLSCTVNICTYIRLVNI